MDYKSKRINAQRYYNLYGKTGFTAGRKSYNCARCRNGLLVFSRHSGSVFSLVPPRRSRNADLSPLDFEGKSRFRFYQRQRFRRERRWFDRRHGGDSQRDCFRRRATRRNALFSAWRLRCRRQRRFQRSWITFGNRHSRDDQPSERRSAQLF